MQENNMNIRDAVNGIAYMEETKDRILEGVSQKKEKGQKAGTGRSSKGLMVSGKVKAAIAFACVAVILVAANTRKGSPYSAQISVYAKGLEGEEEQVVMSPDQEIELAPVETAGGYGYVFEVSLPEHYTYEMTVSQTDENCFTIYQDDQYIYCQYIEDDSAVKADDQYVPVVNSQNDIAGWIGSQYVNGSGKFELIIYDENTEVSEKQTIQFLTTGVPCIAVLYDSQDQE